GIGPKRVKQLLAHFSLAELLILIRQQNQTRLQQMGIDKRTINALCKQAPPDPQADLQWLAASSKHHIVTWDHPDYPQQLLCTDTAPPVLFVNGQISCLNDPQLAIVGSRTPTAQGKQHAYEFAYHLAQMGLCITSGLALGVDGESHRGALAANAPTIAVTATGLDRVYPAKHRSLAHQITEQGALVSEFPIGVEARSQNFPRRNRIISGLSVGTLVVEATLNSGSLLTAEHALEQGREVFAIPDSIHNPLAKGCHALIRQGAKLVENATHILEEISPILDIPKKAQDIKSPLVIDNTFAKPIIPTTLPTASADESMQNTSTAAVEPAGEPMMLVASPNHAVNPTALDPEYQQLLAEIPRTSIAVDQLIHQTGLTADTISSMLLMLELQGYITAKGNGRYTRLS
ncbi:MAG TPA: DNA-protecting protein DprA, partial [Thiothrix sp.]|nr:DNA-protecting protein DprA [Thiothrix sp.]